MLNNVIRPAVCSWSPSSKHIQKQSSSLFEKKRKASGMCVCIEYGSRARMYHNKMMYLLTTRLLLVFLQAWSHYLAETKIVKVSFEIWNRVGVVCITAHCIRVLVNHAATLSVLALLTNPIVAEM